MNSSKVNHLEIFKASGLLKNQDKMRLHLGCGRTYFEGYINIDFPVDLQGSLRTTADFCMDIRDLRFPPESIDEIRLHHVFEHFGRVEALALLIRWHSWLKIRGLLRIETPDIIGSAKTLISDAPWDIKMATIRHMAGDQTASWGYHADHWFEDRFRRTLKDLGFAPINTVSYVWDHKPFLSNVEVFAVKMNNVAIIEQLQQAYKILLESTVLGRETHNHKLWMIRLRELLC